MLRTRYCYPQESFFRRVGVRYALKSEEASWNAEFARLLSPAARAAAKRVPPSAT